MQIDLGKCFPVGADGRQAPLPKQNEFMRCVLNKDGPKFVSYFGGFGSGKSLILCITMISQGVLHGGEYVIAREFMPELRRTTMKLFLELLPPELLLEHRVADAEVHIKSVVGKAIFYFVGLDSPEKLDSLTLSGAAIDEASQVSEEAFLKLQGRLRSPRGLRKLLLVGNPKGHDWIYRYFIKQDMFDSPAKKAQYRMIVAPSTENKHLPEGYIESMLASYSPERIKRDIMGSFDSFEGMVYADFDRQVHVVKPFKIPDDWVRNIGIDVGFTNPTCWLWGATNYDGDMYIYREFYESGWITEEIVKGFNKAGVKKPGVMELMGYDPVNKKYKETIQGAYIDPSSKAIRGQTGLSDWDLYLDHLPKDFPLMPAKNDVEAGIDLCKYYLKVNVVTKRPKLYIFDTCVNFLDEIAQYRYAELSPSMQGKTNQKEQPRKYKDHAMDSFKYLIASRPEAPRLKDKKEELRKAATLEGSIQRELHEKRNPRQKDPFGDY